MRATRPTAPPARAPVGALVFAWAGAGAFAGSLLFFLYCYLIRFGRPAPPGPIAAPIATDVVLFTLFALHHSVFARPAIKRRVAALLPAPLERSLYTWIASGLFLGVCAAWRDVPGQLYRLTGAIAGAAYLVQAIGIWLTARSSALLDVLDLAGVRPVLNARGLKTPGPQNTTTRGPQNTPHGLTTPGLQNPPLNARGLKTPDPQRTPGLQNMPLSGDSRAADSLCGPGVFRPRAFSESLDSESSDPDHVPLVTTGLYGFVRHPLYFAWTLVVFAAPDMTLTRFTFAAVSTAYLAIAIPFEERALVRLFGTQYSDYQRAVKWRMIPGLY